MDVFDIILHEHIHQKQDVITLFPLKSHLIFGFTAVRPAPYVIINGILILIYAIIEYGIVKSDS